MSPALVDTFLNNKNMNMTSAEDLYRRQNITRLGPDETVSTDPVNHPPHYTVGAIECIDAIRAALTDDEFRGYCKGNALKYLWRERHKGSTESLQKANWYLNRLVRCPPPPSPSK